MSSPERNDDAEEFRAAFEDGPGGRDMVEAVWNNDPHLCSLDMSYFVQLLNPLQWSLLGRCIARNTHLKKICLEDLTDRCMSDLFSEFHQCPNLVELIVRRNHFGREGIESMLPLVRNSRKLAKLSLIYNDGMDDECFRLIVGTLDGGGIERLTMAVCGITDMTALRNCTFPHLKALNLSGNRISAGLSALEHLDTLEELCLDHIGIGLEQCIELTSLLRNPSTLLRTLSLKSNELSDESIEALAGALKHNSTLEELHLDDSNVRTIPLVRMGARGYLALLRLLSDASSIDSMYNSNHTLVDVGLPHNASNPEAQQMKKLFRETLAINRLYRAIPEKAGQIKVLRSQLNSKGRKEMCGAQSIEFASTGSILADIDSYLLPNVLALVGRSPRDGRDELFNTLIETAPDLMALIDREALMENLLSRKMAQIAALTAEADSLSRRLRLLKGGDEPGAKKMRRC